MTVLANCDGAGDSALGLGIVFAIFIGLLCGWGVWQLLWLDTDGQERSALSLLLLCAVLVAGFAFALARSGETGGGVFLGALLVDPALGFAAGRLTGRFGAWIGALVAFLGALLVPVGFLLVQFVIAVSDECVG